MKKLLCLMLLSSALLSGCASIVGEKTQSISINSIPDKAQISIYNHKNILVHQGNTPNTVTLPKSDGSYFGGETYKVVFEKEGYASKTVTITSSANGWYIAGNLFFGSVIGWLIVDPLTGAMYTLSPDSISETMQQNTLQFYLMENLTESQKQKLIKIA